MKTLTIPNSVAVYVLVSQGVPRFATVPTFASGPHSCSSAVELQPSGGEASGENTADQRPAMNVQIDNVNSIMGHCRARSMRLSTRVARSSSGPARKHLTRSSLSKESALPSGNTINCWAPITTATSANTMLQ